MEIGGGETNLKGGERTREDDCFSVFCRGSKMRKSPGGSNEVGEKGTTEEET